LDKDGEYQEARPQGRKRMEDPILKKREAIETGIFSSFESPTFAIPVSLK
jgi:hypothetical protein